MSVGSPSRPPEPPIFQILWRRKLPVLLITFLGLLAGLAYLAIAHKTYFASASLQVHPVTPMVLGQPGNQPEQSENYLKMQCRIIESLPVMVLAMGQPGIDESRTLEGIPDARRNEFLKNSVTADTTKEDTIDVTFAGPVQDEVARFADAIVAGYKELNSHRNNETASSELKTLTSQKDEAERQRAGALDKMQALRPLAGADGLGDSSLATQRLMSLTEALKQAQIQTANASVGYDTARELVVHNPAMLRQADEAVSTATSSDIDKLKGDVFRYQEALKDLERSYLPDHPLVRTTRARLQQLVIDLVAANHQRYLDSLRLENELQKRYDDESKLATQQAITSADYRKYSDDAETLKARIDQLDTQIHNVMIVRDAHDLEISDIEEGTLDPSLTKPNRMKTLAMAMAMGLMLGAGYGLVREKMDPQIGVKEHATAAAGVPLLGVIPEVPGLSEVANPAVIDENNSELAAAIKGVLRTAFYVAGSNNPLNSILITSPSAAEGRSTIVANLAAAIAQSGRTVVVVDADYRSPVQHKFFDVENRMGLSTLLTSHESIEKVVRPTGIEGIEVLPTGPVLTNPTEMFNSQAFAELLADLTSKYDHVVIDSPAVNGGRDARIIAAHCDTTILVLASTKANRRMIAQARDGLLHVGANLLGVVVNDAPVRFSRTIAPASAAVPLVEGAASLRMTEVPFTAIEPGRQAQRG